jgi:hypothetical protein
MSRFWIIQFAGALLLTLATGQRALAQSNEVTFLRGEGKFFAGSGTQRSRVGSLMYGRRITDRVAVEGGLDWLLLRGDGFAGFQVAGVYHLRSTHESGRLLPFVAVGIGNTSTDLTELPVHAVYHVRAGLKYYVIRPIGVRVEFANRLIHTDNDRYFQGAGNWTNLPSIDIGFSVRY